MEGGGRARRASGRGAAVGGRLAKLPPPGNSQALKLGILPAVRLRFIITGTLHTVRELNRSARSGGAFRISSGWRLESSCFDSDVFKALGPQQIAALRGCSGRLSPLAPTPTPVG